MVGQVAQPVGAVLSVAIALPIGIAKLLSLVAERLHLSGALNVGHRHRPKCLVALFLIAWGPRLTKMNFFGMDLAEAARLVESENFGDWYRDPWGWPELRVTEMVDLEPADVGLIVGKGAGWEF